MIYLGVRGRALRVARRYGIGAPLDDKARTSHLRSQPPSTSNLWALRVKGPLGYLDAITRHVGSRLNPSGEILQFGALGRKFAKSATKTIASS